jgi:hypothetical protein
MPEPLQGVANDQQQRRPPQTVLSRLGELPRFNDQSAGGQRDVLGAQPPPDGMLSIADPIAGGSVQRHFGW